jgi:hypothetical protein
MDKMRGEMVLNLFCPAELLEVAEVIFAASINGFEMYAGVAAGNDLTSCEDIYREVNRHRPGMKQI